MKAYTWRERDEEGLTFYRANHHGGRWTISSQRKGEEDWEYFDPVPDEIWEKLREQLYNKYRRGRCTWKMVVGIDKRLGREESEPE